MRFRFPRGRLFSGSYLKDKPWVDVVLESESSACLPPACVVQEANDKLEHALLDANRMRAQMATRTFPARTGTYVLQISSDMQHPKKKRISFALREAAARCTTSKKFRVTHVQKILQYC